MPRKARLFIPHAIYHVYCRTARGERVFDCAEEAAHFVETVRWVRDTDGFRVFAWCLMGNHYHLILRTGEVPLWSSMARIQGRVARSFNRRHGYLGRLWQSRYKARVVDSERYFNQAVAYVHLNPVAAGLVEDPAGYEWSGHGSLIGRRKPLLIDVKAFLMGYGSTISIGRRIYMASIRAVAEARWLDMGLRELPWWASVNDSDTIVEPGEVVGAVQYDGRPAARELPDIEAEDLVRLVARREGVGVDDLAGARRSAPLVASRVVLTAVAVLKYGHSVTEVARLLEKNPATVSRWLGIARWRLIADTRFADRVSQLVDDIAEGHNAIKRYVAP
jgi:REP element-mobilizing transposase RayT